ncbi:2-deoxycytidine 5-triphosphate deaminase [Parvibaculum lavamentivorans DS-1]|uniref:2-deoxycytidine 5-triphosphate deaminase n=1 Tax=Parvibaculum lavamentivorans (strain DS-1 / DSM 13023 / NCIMB 13966) TaxID=402881 RepID=A7HQ50_PARL1|nr:2'-deoxycytidine 5'-triphosphate deaminase [Parvibaculum lavamentivorans]ABS62033.1 2-deoxycytidine 5-triphosphate deaminase [Parvibaculum lavamentivorans DS-1]
MTKAASDLFPNHSDEPRRVGPGQLHATGILPSHGIQALIREKEIWGGLEIDPAQIQPASLDLRLGATAYRLRASFLPGPDHGVMERVEELMLHKIDLTDGAVLETGCVYLVPLVEALALSERTSASANPKSSTGRLDVFTRLITDFCAEFDQVAAGYKGHLYLEISPRTFPILVRPGSRLAQIRFRRGTHTSSDAEMKRLHEELRLVDGEADIDGGIALTVNLAAETEDEVVGYRAKRHSGVIDIDKIGVYDVRDFWDPVHVRPGKGLILDPDEFYILASREALHIPATHAAEMVAYNPLVGEFRVHYAGFFDPGFGAREAGGAGSRIVLEVRSHEVPFILEHGQIIGRFVLERLTDRPTVLYGAGLGSNYQRQGLKLSKHFRTK